MNKTTIASMLRILHTRSINKSTNKLRTKSTPSSDDRVNLTEINICYSIEYFNHKIKTFWDGAKAYTYPIKSSEVDSWNELISELPILSDEDIESMLTDW